MAEDNPTPPDEAPAAAPLAPVEPARKAPRPAFWTATPTHLATDWKVVVVLAGVLLAGYVPGLGSYGLFDPWETHYGEVARNMVEYDDYIDPFWGSPWDPNGVKREREGFYSKPLLIMWMMSAGMRLFGYNELGVRFFFPLIAVLALLAIYLAVSRFYNRRAGLLATVLLGAAPFFVFLSRQAVPDGLLVSIMSAGMMSLSIGLFLVKDEEEASPLLYWFTMGLLLVVMVGQLWAILPMDRSPDVVRPYPGSRNLLFAAQWWLQEVLTVARGKGWAISAALVPLAMWAGWRVARQRRRRMLYIYLFYIACGLAVPAKGWLGWAPMGGAILGYLIVTGDWKLLARVDIPTGLLVVFMTGHPWIVAMLGG
ncbi:MAG: glycosyltransferase family 39 protein, partial [Myxococcales bacterium]|nr:glycosyltransferase family 39 protein [Myxococcales bacterium]